MSLGIVRVWPPVSVPDVCDRSVAIESGCEWRAGEYGLSLVAGAQCCSRLFVGLESVGQMIQLTVLMGRNLLSASIFGVCSRSRSRVAVAGLVGAGALALAGFAGVGTASADPLICEVSNGHNVIRVEGNGGCGAKAGPGSTARATDQSGAGTAVASADTGGNANALNLQAGAAALSGAISGGTGYAVTTGPGGMSVSQARDGGTSIAIAGWGGTAYSGPYGAQCTGSFAAAVDTNTGQGCIGAGGLWLSTPR